MKISFNIPDEWDKVLQQARVDAGSQSIAQFMKLLLEESDRIKKAMVKAEVADLPSLETIWGGPRKQVDQDSQVAQDGPSELSAAKAAAVIKLMTGKSRVDLSDESDEPQYVDLEE